MHLEVDFELIDEFHLVIVPKLKEGWLELDFALEVIRIVLIQSHRMGDQSSHWLLTAQDYVVGIDIANSSNHDLRNSDVIARNTIHY